MLILIDFNCEIYLIDKLTDKYDIIIKKQKVIICF